MIGEGVKVGVKAARALRPLIARLAKSPAGRRAARRAIAKGTAGTLKWGGRANHGIGLALGPLFAYDILHSMIGGEGASGPGEYQPVSEDEAMTGAVSSDEFLNYARHLDSGIPEERMLSRILGEVEHANNSHRGSQYGMEALRSGVSKDMELQAMLDGERSTLGAIAQEYTPGYAELAARYGLLD